MYGIDGSIEGTENLSRLVEEAIYQPRVNNV